ncbi:MAG: flagellar hook-associated protein FlgK [Thermomicrobium sp.]|nr:flagellar hook-associated protein FlgK [Thermomicrobium sp.]
MVFRALETAFRGLMAQQRAVDTASHNIANAHTPGFSRQRVQLVPSTPYTVPAFNRSGLAGQVGTGVLVASITRVRESVFDVQFRVQTQALGEASAQVDAYAQIEAVFNEPTEAGLGRLLDRFWRAWQGVSNQPEDLAARAALVQEATTLATNLNRMRRQLGELQSDAAAKLALQVSDVNSIAQRLATLNQQIVASLATGQTPNDLLDQRDVLLDKLASFTGATLRTLPNGAVNLYLGGYPLVDQDQWFPLTVQVSGGTASILWQGTSSPVAVERGSLQALLGMHNTVLPGLVQKLEAIRDTLANEVNALHATGYGLTDPAGPPPGRPFFVVTPGGDLEVEATIVADPQLVVAADAADEPGNNAIARAIAELRSKLVLNGNTATINDFYNTLVAAIGGASQTAQVTRDNQQALVQAIDRQRQEIMSVSLDEEMANLIKFQQAYGAAARAITAVDEMLDRIINGMGLVGR